MKIVFAQGKQNQNNGRSPDVLFIHENGLVARKKDYDSSIYYQEHYPIEIKDNKNKAFKQIKKIEFTDRSFSSWGVPQLKG
jgi:hypothetical protein